MGRKDRHKKPGFSTDHLTPKVRGGGLTAEIPDDFHQDRHIVFVHLTFIEMPGQLAMMEDHAGRLNPRFMRGDFKAANERRFGIGSTGDHAWEVILNMYGVDIVRDEMDRQRGDRSFADILYSQLRKYAMVYGDEVVGETIEGLQKKLDRKVRKEKLRPDAKKEGMNGQ